MPARQETVVLTGILSLPLAAALVALGMAGRDLDRYARQLGLVASLATLLMTLGAWLRFDVSSPAIQLVERAEWIPALGVAYHVGVDGISLLLVTLTAWLTVVALMAPDRPRSGGTAGLVAAVLLIEACCLAVFAARDVMLFTFAAEVMVLPACALVGRRGRERPIRSAMKLLVSSLAGGAALLPAMLWIGWRHQLATGVWSFAVDDLSGLAIGAGAQWWLLSVLLFSFGIRTPFFPLHSWFTDAVAQAPTAGAVMLCGAMTSAGAYGLLRIGLPLVPDAWGQLAPWIAVVAAVAAVYGAVIALAQHDLRRTLAFMSVSQMGVVMLGVSGLSQRATQGAVFLVVCHALWTTTWLLGVGALAARRNTTRIEDFGGLQRVLPRLTVVFAVLVAAVLLLPGTPAFVGASLVLGVTRQESPPGLAMGLTFVAGAGMMAGAVVALRSWFRTCRGPLTHDRNRGLRDLTSAELLLMIPACLLVVALGLWPAPVLRTIEAAVSHSAGRLLATDRVEGP